jgi:hypothetical protein
MPRVCVTKESSILAPPWSRRQPHKTSTRITSTNERETAVRTTQPHSPLPPSSPPPASSPEDVLPRLPFVPAGEPPNDSLSAADADASSIPELNEEDPFGFLAAEHALKARRTRLRPSSERSKRPIIRPPTPIDTDVDEDLYAPPPPTLFASKTPTHEPATPVERARKRKHPLTPSACSRSSSLAPTPTRPRLKANPSILTTSSARSKENNSMDLSPSPDPAETPVARRTRTPRQAAIQSAEKARRNIRSTTPAARGSNRRAGADSSRRKTRITSQRRARSGRTRIPPRALEQDEPAPWSDDESREVLHFHYT